MAFPHTLSSEVLTFAGESPRPSLSVQRSMLDDRKTLISGRVCLFSALHVWGICLGVCTGRHSWPVGKDQMERAPLLKKPFHLIHPPASVLVTSHTSRGCSFPVFLIPAGGNSLCSLTVMKSFPDSLRSLCYYTLSFTCPHIFLFPQLLNPSSGLIQPWVGRVALLSSHIPIEFG